MSDSSADDAELRDALKQATTQLADARASSNRLPSLRAEIADERGRLQRLRATLAAEQQDVDHLTGLSLTHLWSALTGRTDQKRSEEQKEVDALLVEVASSERAFKQRQTTLAIVQKRASEVPACQQRQRELVDELAQRLVAKGSPDAAKITELTGVMLKQSEAVTQLDEVIRAAEPAMSLLGRMDSLLRSASSWSTYDTWFGGGIISSSIKHNRVDEASSLIGDAHSALRLLAAEVSDVTDLVAVSAPEISPGLRTADIWFDNIFSDWMVGDRIRASAESVRRTQGQVGALYADAKSRRAQAADQLAQSEREYLQLFTI